jgi:hypothetical protein
LRRMRAIFLRSGFHRQSVDLPQSPASPAWKTGWTGRRAARSSSRILGSAGVCSQGAAAQRTSKEKPSVCHEVHHAVVQQGCFPVWPAKRNKVKEFRINHSTVKLHPQREYTDQGTEWS